jgi:hypothetical protein
VAIDKVNARLERTTVLLGHRQADDTALIKFQCVPKLDKSILYPCVRELRIRKLFLLFA